MKKNTLLAALLLILTMALMIVFTGCGEQTLEDYINSDAETAEQIDSLSEKTGLTIDVSGNTLSCTYTYEQTFDDAMIEQAAARLEGSLEVFAPTLENFALSLEEQTGIENITVKVVYQDGAGTEIYATEY